MNCPQCGKSDIRHSHSSHWSDLLHRVFGGDAFRCRQCQARFFVRRVAPDIKCSKEQSKRGRSEFMRRKRLVRRLVTIAVFVAMFSLFGLFLLHITKDHPARPTMQETGVDQ
jgi:hypothetical protein